MMARTKRLWYSLLLSHMIEGYSYEQICQVYRFDPIAFIAELEQLHQTTRMTASKTQRFCQEMGWNILGRLISEMKELLEVKTPKELRGLMQELPMLSRKKSAHLLVEHEITSRKLFLTQSAESIVQLLQLLLSMGFELQVSTTVS